MVSIRSYQPDARARLFAACVALTLLADSTSAGTAHFVGPTRPFNQINSAITAASTGDVILVDPGAYQSFTVDGKGLSIVGNGGVFTINPVANQPEIRVRNIGSGTDVTIIDAQIAYLDTGAPAVRVENCAGAVRFSRLDVRPFGDMLTGTTAQAMVEVDATKTFWLVDSSIYWDEQLPPPATGPLWYVARTLNPITAGNPPETNDGVSAVQLRNSHGVIQNSRLRGYQGNTYGGDGLRIVDDGTDLADTSAWLLQDRLTPDYATTFIGGPGDHGGHALHQIRTPFDSNLMRSCGGPDNAASLSYGPGASILSGGELGGVYGRNNDPGITGGGGGLSYQFPDHCNDTQRNESTVTLSTVPLGGAFTTRVRTKLDRRYLLYYCTSARYQYSIPPFSGRGVADFLVAIAAPTAGTTVGGVTSTHTVIIPTTPSLIGIQFSVQAAFGPVGGNLTNIGIPGHAVIVP